MSYESLFRLYRKSPAVWEEVYRARCGSPFTKHLGIRIKEYNRSNGYDGFFCYCEDMSLRQERIMIDFAALQKTLLNIPQAGIDQYLHDCLVDEIKASNDIEGVRSTRREIRSALTAGDAARVRMRLGGIVDKYARIIDGAHIAMEHSRDMRVLFDSFLAEEIGRSDPKNLPDGMLFRKESVDIITGTQKVIHRGIYPEPQIIHAMDAALLILHDTSMPALVRIAVFHYLFGYIHPFYDGNGRMSRFITSYMLARTLHPTVALRLSILLKQNKKRYYDLFAMTNASVNCGDLTPFILGTLEFVNAAVSGTEKNLREKKDRYDVYYSRIQKLEVDRTLKELYDVLLQATIFSGAGVSKKELMRMLDKSENTITARMKAMPSGVLRENRTVRPFSYALNLRALDEPM